MYKLLLKNRITNSGLLVGLLLLLLCTRFFRDDQDYDGPSGWLYQEWFGTESVSGDWIWVFLLLTIQLYILIDFMLRYKISSEASLIPGLIFVLFACLIPEFQSLQPIHFANTFLLLSLRELFGISPRQSSAKKIFNAGMWLAVAFLFYAPYLWFIIALVSGINILRSWRYNDIKTLLIGFLIPLFLIGVYYFWMDRFTEYFKEITSSIGLVSFREGMDYFNLGILVLILSGVLTVVVFNTRVLTKKTILKQNYFKIIYWALFCCLLQFLFQRDQGVEHLLVLTLPLALLLSEYMINWKESKSIALANMFLLVTIVLQFKDSILALF